jgi:ArsR family transcriptional regulator
MPAALEPLLDSFSLLADQTRVRMLAVLERQELTVGEVCSILQLPQSTVSRHLKLLADAGWVSSRREGTSRYYALAVTGDGRPHAQLWEITRGQLQGRAVEQDARRLTAVVARRRESSARFFSTAAGEWDRLREDLFGRDFVTALFGLLPDTWTIGDLGCGTGATLPLLAPYVRQVIGVDASEDMLSAARERVAALENVELRAGTLEALPIDDGTLDAATLMLVLHHLASPAEALAEAHRVLSPGGRLLIVDMAPHDREEYRQGMGHVWLGFGADQIERLLSQAGFGRIRIRALPPSANAKGPGLFAATADNREGARVQRAS